MGKTASLANIGTIADSSLGFRNRIINGAMVIDARNAGASVTPTNQQYSLDRWLCGLTQTSKYSVQQNAGAVTPPTGFINYLGVTSLSAYSVVSGDLFYVQQRIEGFNLSDLGWGTASAATVTLSFQVRSSLTGTFGGAIYNNGGTRSYPFTFTISTANTWTAISVTIAGDTSGTWLTNNGIGATVTFNLGAGSTYSGTANTWAGAFYTSATGATSVVGTNGATFYITGVQLEKGSTATSFDYRPYGTELALCQRYYYRLTQPTASSYFPASGLCTSSTLARVAATFPVTMRAVPTALDTTGTASNYAVISTTATAINLTAVPSLNDTTANGGIIGVTVSTGLTAGHAAIFYANLAGAYIGWSAEL